MKKGAILILGVVLLAALTAGCGTSTPTTSGATSTTGGSPSTTTGPSSPTSGTTSGSGNYSIMTSSSSSLGTFLVDGNGRTLYHFTIDSPNSSKCTSGGCLAAWPVFYASSVEVPSGLTASDFTAFTRSDGTKQTAYKGEPLYYYFGDTVPGETYGQGLFQFGGYWYVVPPQ